MITTQQAKFYSDCCVTVSDSRSVGYLFCARCSIRKPTYIRVSDACCYNQLLLLNKLSSASVIHSRKTSTNRRTTEVGI